MGWGLQTKALEARPVFLNYLSRVTQRPAYQRYMENNAALAAMN